MRISVKHFAKVSRVLRGIALLAQLCSYGRSMLVVVGGADDLREDARYHVVIACAIDLCVVGNCMKVLLRSVVLCMDAHGAGWTCGGALVLEHRRLLPRSPSYPKMLSISSRA